MLEKAQTVSTTGFAAIVPYQNLTGIFIKCNIILRRSVISIVTVALFIVFSKRRAAASELRLPIKIVISNQRYDITLK